MMNHNLPTILYLFDKGADTFAVFRAGKRTYTRRCSLLGGMYGFHFKGQLWRCYGARLYD